MRHMGVWYEDYTASRTMWDAKRQNGNDVEIWQLYNNDEGKEYTYHRKTDDCKLQDIEGPMTAIFNWLPENATYSSGCQSFDGVQGNLWTYSPGGAVDIYLCAMKDNTAPLWFLENVSPDTSIQIEFALFLPGRPDEHHFMLPRSCLKEEEKEMMDNE